MVKQSHYRPNRHLGFQEVEAPRFQDNQRMKVVRLSALRTDRLYPPRDIPGTYFCQRLSRPQGHSAPGSSKLMKDSSDPIGNQTCDVPASSAMPQPTATPCVPGDTVILVMIKKKA